MSKEKENEDFYKKHYDLLDRVSEEAFELGKKMSLVPPDEEKYWKQYGEVEACRLFRRKVENSSYKMFQGVSIVTTKRDVREIAQVISDISFKTKYKDFLLKCGRNKFPPWISNFVHSRDISRDRKSQVLLHFRMPTGSRIVYDRDFFIIREVRHEEEASYFFGKSLPEDEVKSKHWPRFKGCVRGEIMLYCWKIQRIDEDRVRFQYINHTNPAGWIPSGIFNAVGSSSVLACQRYCENLKEYFAGEDNFF